jgi:hypothetical protein
VHVVDPIDWFCTPPGPPSADAGAGDGSGAGLGRNGSAAGGGEDEGRGGKDGGGDRAGGDVGVGEGAGLCPLVVGGIFVYRDSRHIASNYARFLTGALADALDPVMPAAAARAGGEAGA